MNKGDVVTNINYKKGYKVVRGKDWNYKDQDENSVYGVILNNPKNNDSDCEVLWIDSHNHGLKKYTYFTGRGNKYDLAFYEDTIDYSIDDMFADLDLLAEKFK